MGIITCCTTKGLHVYMCTFPSRQFWHRCASCYHVYVDLKVTPAYITPAYIFFFNMQTLYEKVSTRKNNNTAPLNPMQCTWVGTSFRDVKPLMS